MRPPAQVLTLKDISDRCDLVGNCWVWKQGTNSEGVPQVRTRGKNVLVRREVALLSNGNAPSRGWFVVSACQDKLCVAPGCIRILSPAKFIEWMNTTGRLNTPAQAIAKAAAAARRSPLTNESVSQLRELIANGADRGETAASFGITRSYANRIAAGRNRRPAAVGNSVFNL